VTRRISYSLNGSSRSPPCTFDLVCTIVTLLGKRMPFLTTPYSTSTVSISYGSLSHECPFEGAAAISCSRVARLSQSAGDHACTFRNWLVSRSNQAVPTQSFSPTLMAPLGWNPTFKALRPSASSSPRL